MSEYAPLRRLRPYLFFGFRRYRQPLQLRSLVTQQGQLAKEKKTDVTRDYEKRVAQLQGNGSGTDWYPRLPPGFAASRVPIYQFQQEHGHLLPQQTNVDQKVTVAGKIQSVRTAGGKLAFIDLQEDGCIIQVVCAFDKLAQGDNQVALPVYKQLLKVARKGDAFSVTGNPHRTQTGQLSVLATCLPTLLSPSLHQVPEKYDDAEARARNRHVDMIVNPEAQAALLVRHHVDIALQTFFNTRGFIRANTPILNSVAGGATARPFETEATELLGERLNLRIAPELWLKRLVIGGLEKVYEIGPAFRNEGVDLTHNPEFNICEFYEAYATLDDLKQTTQALFKSLSGTFQKLRNDSSDNSPLKSIPEPDLTFSQTFATIEFIPKLEELLGSSLPDLEAEDATERTLEFLQAHSIPVPTHPTLPRLLDALAGAVLEPLSHARPTFITHHPACMSPLSKDFRCATTGQRVAARAELFVAGREYANMYEEENSPFAQRAKFESQRRLRAVDAEAMVLDESYLQALEWGLPPTGGWGCGVDRLVMLFAGRGRMADVLAFGSLRNVVGMGKVGVK